MASRTSIQLVFDILEKKPTSKIPKKLIDKCCGEYDTIIRNIPTEKRPSRDLIVLIKTVQQGKYSTNIGDLLSKAKDDYQSLLKQLDIKQHQARQHGDAIHKVQKTPVKVASAQLEQPLIKQPQYIDENDITIRQLQGKLDDKERSLLGKQKQIKELEKQVSDYKHKHGRDQSQIQQLQDQLLMEELKIQNLRQLNKHDDKQKRDYDGSQSLMSDEYKDVDVKASRQNSNTCSKATPLSDNDKPTKIVERYYDIYDNEWTDAEDELHETMNTDKSVAAFLLDIVQADSGQLDKKQTSVQDAYEFGSLVQYRKEVAEHAIDRLIKEFLRKYDADGKYKPKTRVFAEKCVDVTWWMCVQDPPIYMVDGKDSIVFQTEMYKPFTKTGKRIEFVVWPALQLYKDGPVLAKGVAQGK